ncbi:MAG: hypothetical protein ACPLKZ_07430 [Candidatus Bathyarchaeales archaeon]
MIEINNIFLKTWRERYKWPLFEGRKASEEKIFRLEETVKNNVLCKGSKSVKEAILEVVIWKTNNRFQTVREFQYNSDEIIESVIEEVQGLLRKDSDNVAEVIKKLTSLEGVKIAVASTILRFLDSFEHKCGIIDKNVATLLNREHITNFLLRRKDNYVMYTQSNICEYQKFHNWLQKKAREIVGTTYTDIYGTQKNFTPVDVEMALFAFATQFKKR